MEAERQGRLPPDLEDAVVLQSLPAAIPVRLPVANAQHLLSQTASSSSSWAG